MPPQGRPLLGVDINQHEIRVVELRTAGTSAQVLRAGYVPVPAGAVEGDRIVYTDALGDTLRGLLNRMAVSTRQAVLGIGAQACITRVLDIPRVPDDEIRMVIEGELAHYQILREGSGAFDFVRLTDPEGRRDATPQVLLMAAEDRITSLLREVAERAGLQPIALEPVLLAMYRAAYIQARAQPSTAVVSVSFARSEVAIVDRGHIRLYRRVDVGSDDIVPGRGRSRNPITGELARGPLLWSEEGPEDAGDSLEGASPAITSATAGTLATEVQRSLDYYRREFPNAPTVTRILLATNDPEAEPLAEWLGQSLNLDCVLVEPPVVSGVSRALAAQLEAPEGLRFVAAAGLAMRGMPALPEQVPAFDLSHVERAPLAAGVDRGRLVISGGISLLLLIGAVILGLTLNRRISAMEHHLGELKQELVGKQNLEQGRIQDLIAQRDMVAALRQQGVPFPRIVDAVAAVLDPEAGLTEFTVDRSGRIALSAEAANERAMIRSLDGLKNCPYFLGTTLDSFARKGAAERSQVVEFKVSSQLLGAQPSAPAAPNP